MVHARGHAPKASERPEETTSQLRESRHPIARRPYRAPEGKNRRERTPCEREEATNGREGVSDGCERPSAGCEGPSRGCEEASGHAFDPMMPYDRSSQSRGNHRPIARRSLPTARKGKAVPRRALAPARRGGRSGDL